MAAPLRETVPLQKRKIVKKSIGGVLGALVFVGVVFLFSYVFFHEMDEMAEEAGARLGPLRHVMRSVVVALTLGLVALAVAATPVYQYLYFRSYFYDVDEENVTIRKGVVAKKEITLPFSKVTDVYVDQDVADALFRLYDVHISTPTASSGEFAHIDGVNKEGSLALKELLLERVNEAAA